MTKPGISRRDFAQQAARRPKQLTPMGNQGHTFEGTRQMRGWTF